MKIYPAIDIQNGRCVRLKQGRAADETIYADDPAQMAQHWIDQGAQILHVVDLDAAFQGTSNNADTIARICECAEEAGIPVQLGGGIRDEKALELRWQWGVERAIIGTAALENPTFVQKAASRYPGRIIAGIDAKNGLVATQGWAKESETLATILGKELFEMGICECVYTDIHRDGMMIGPNIEQTKKMEQETGLHTIASGGISSLEDIKALQMAGITGAIVGRALYDEAFTLPEAMQWAKV